MLGAGGHDIDAGSIDTAVAQNVRQLGDVLFDSIKGPGEQFSQIMMKHLRFFYARSAAQAFICRQMLLRSRVFRSFPEKSPLPGCFSA